MLCLTSCSLTNGKMKDELVFVSDGKGSCVLGEVKGYYQKDVVIPQLSPVGDKVIGIADEAFCGSNASSITVPEGVNTVGVRAFAECKNLHSVSLPSTVSEIGADVLRDCPSLVSISVADANPVYLSAGNCLIKTDDKVLIAGCKSSIIPMDGSVCAIGDGAFRGASGLSEMNVPEGIISVGARAFSGCEQMSVVYLPSTLMELGEYAFNGCTLLNRVTVPAGVSELPEGVFRNCSSLKRATLSVGLVTISESAFFGCSKLVEAKIPKTVEYIGDQAFLGCSALWRIDVYPKLQYVGEMAFAYTGIHNVYGQGSNPIFIVKTHCIITKEDGELIFAGANAKIPADGTVRSIKAKAFFGTKLAAVTVPDSVERIGDLAFAYCEALKTVEIAAGVSEMGENVFYGCDSLKNVNCHAASMPEGWAPNWFSGGNITVWGYVPPPPEESAK